MVAAVAQAAGMEAVVVQPAWVGASRVGVVLSHAADQRAPWLIILTLMPSRLKPPNTRSRISLVRLTLHTSDTIASPLRYVTSAT